MGSWKKHCEALSLPEGASAQEIRAAYRKLALQLHPDRNGGDSSASERFQRVNNSYRFLLANLASRPGPERHAPPPVPASARRETIRPPRAKKSSRKFPAPKPPLAFQRLWKKHQRVFVRYAPLAATALAVSVCLCLFHAREAPAPLMERPPGPAPRAPAAVAAPPARCEIKRLTEGATEWRQWVEMLDENACRQTCTELLTRFSSDSALCFWNEKEFQRNNFSSPELAATAPYAVEAEHTQFGAEFVYQQGPDDDPSIPLEVRHLDRAKTELLVFNAAVRVWIPDSSFLRGAANATRGQVYLTAMKKGEGEILVTDLLNQPIKRIFYIIR